MSLSRKIALALMVPASVATLTANASDGLVFGNASGWTVYTEPAQSYRCSAEAKYEGGTLVRVGFDASGAPYLKVVDSEWAGVEAGSVHEARLSFDGQREFTADGEALASSDQGSGGIRLVIPADAHETFVARFMASHTLTITIAEGNAIDLSLAGSRNAMRMLGDCRTSMTEVVDRLPG